MMGDVSDENKTFNSDNMSIAGSSEIASTTTIAMELGGDESEGSETKHSNDYKEAELRIQSEARNKLPNSEIEASTYLDIEKGFNDLVKNLEALEVIVSDIIAFPSSAENYSKLHKLAATIHRSITKFGSKVEMGQIQNSILDSSNEKKSNAESNLLLDPEKRARLCSIGRALWLTVRQNPIVFRDNTIAKPSHDDSNGTKEGGHRSCSGEKNRGFDEFQIDRAAASGFVRSIAARLVLIENIRTKNRSVPELIYLPAGDGTLTSLPRASCNEMEFGLKSFARAGRAILVHASDPHAAYSTLSLAAASWEGIKSIGTDGTACGKNAEKEKVSYTVIKRCKDEAFDALILLPDAASLVGCTGKTISLDGKSPFDESASNYECKSSLFIGAAENILAQLHRLDNFVTELAFVSKNYENVEDKPAGDIATMNLLEMQRFLPSLARNSYKHGNRFARLSDFASSQEALRIALQATDRCLEKIRREISIERKNNAKSEHLNVSNASICRSLHIQEQEMLVVSKECFFVLSHVYQALGKKNEAQKYLSRIEKYIDEQRQRDDDIFSETMSQLNKTASLSQQNISFLNTSDLILEGPKYQDRADIKARAQAARAKARHGEAKERAHLAYSKIMINHRSLPVPTEEEEILIDRELKNLVELSTKFDSDTTNDGFCNSSTIRETVDRVFCNRQENVFELALAAARATRTRRLSQKNYHKKTYLDAFEHLLSFYPKNHRRHLFIVLEDISSLIVMIKDDKQNSQQLNLHENAINIAKNFIIQFKSSFSSKPRPSGTTLFSEQGTTANLQESLLNEARRTFALAVSFYRSFDGRHDLCANWCDYLLDVLTLSKTVKVTSGINQRETQEEYTRVSSEVMLIKASSLSMSGKLGAGLKAAREVWERSKEVGNLVTLFDCAIRYETQSNSNHHSIHYPSDTLLELDNAISGFISASTELSSDNCSYRDILTAFPVMCNSCLEHEKGKRGGPIMFGVQQRWIDVLTKSNHMSKVYNRKTADDYEEKISPPGGYSLFGVLGPYLCNFEHLLSKAFSMGDHQWQIQSTQNLDVTLDNVLQFLLKVRERQSPKSQEGSRRKTKPSKSKPQILNNESFANNGDYTTIWEDPYIYEYIGNSKDCIWTAEQLWNCAIQIMASNIPPTESTSCRWLAAQLFSKAHDFVLFSEEEGGDSLTKTFLDCEDFGGLALDKRRHLDFTCNDTKYTDICSEFSAQCLLLAAANVVDDLHNLPSLSSSKDPRPVEIENRLSKTLRRLIAAMSEFKALDGTIDRESDKMISWIALSLLVEIGDDFLSVNTLTHKGLLYRIQSEFFNANSREVTDEVSSSALISFQERSIENSQVNSLEPIKHLYLIACRAETSNMQDTAKYLFMTCVKYLLQKRERFIEGQSHSLGSIQRRTILLVSTVRDAVNVFEDIDNALKIFPSNKSENTSIPSRESEAYSTNEIDFFTIEAHNRAVSLVFIGDIHNAERLLIVALNLLPFSGMDVESHGAEIRQAYRGIVERKGVGAGTISLTTENMISLFGCLTG